MGVHFCQCDGAASADLQLLALGLYPASVKTPKTAFTFSVLDDASDETLNSNVTIGGFYNRLKVKTSRVSPSTVLACHVELGHVNRQYQHITLLKRFGAWNTTKSLQPGQLSLFCVACPQPGVNLKPDWKSDPETCKYTASVVLDGNYSAQHLSSATPAQREVRLGHGTGYFVPEARYLVHLRHAVETKATRVKCVNHRAISQVESEHKGCDVSGVVSIAC
ncbi:hypothetical protein OF83DRAFT_1179718 [Amylostereum chailletii]|nr:hypothetical protein OF83DRAFT_1179718 [Amylostereum chailletii]